MSVCMSRLRATPSTVPKRCLQRLESSYNRGPAQAVASTHAIYHHQWRSYSRSSNTLRVSSRCRIQEPYPSSQRRAYSFRPEASEQTVSAYIALGSNMGDRIDMIEQACHEMDATGKMRVVRTSSLFETKAMYVTDQDKFVNGACEIVTQLSPIELLDELQAIERKMGRVKIIDKGPRNIDLDILLYNGLTQVSEERLQVPHPQMSERMFVLKPLAQLLSKEEDCEYLVFRRKLRHSIKKLSTSAEELLRMTPLGLHLPYLSNYHPHIMSILNVTPDSFSDGGLNHNIDKATLANTIRSHIADGATIIDVGGQSTRPGSTQVSAEEELARVLPALEVIGSMPEADNICISVDTYRARVAEEAIAAGADMINDISGGTMDNDMLPTIAKLGCTVCLMHMRGTPDTMMDFTDYPKGVVGTAGDELAARVRAAESAGIRYWRIVADPGIGFSKTQEGNLSLLRNIDRIRQHPGLKNLPWLVGTSRKGFIGNITGVQEAKERIMGTAAAVACVVRKGVDVVRVHDVKEMVEVVKVADAIRTADGRSRNAA